MSLEHELLKQRLQRTHEISTLGHRPYGACFDASHSVPALWDAHGAKSAAELEAEPIAVRVCGRINSLRGKGKAGFLHLEQGGRKIQVYIKIDFLSENDFKLYQLLDIGDILGVDGTLFHTRTGEFSIHATALTFLSKTLLPMPEKYHGLEDVETRTRQRYLDLIANTDVRATFVARARVTQSLRRQLDAHGFVEVETPMLQPLYGGAAARPFVTHHNTLDLDLYLRIAPELYLKRLIVGGMDRVYEINRNFRNEGISIKHNPEFTMLEFYQAYTDYRGLMDLTEQLLRQVAIDVTGGTKITYQGRELDFGVIRRFSMREAVIEYWRGDNKPSLADLTDPAWLVRHSSKSTSGEMLLDLFERVCEEHLFEPTMIYDYPVEVSPLSKNKPDEPNFVERFEIFCAGMEIGNAYTELNDPNEQRKRFELQLAMAARGDDEAHQMDEDYVRALCYGMPPTGGEGIGIDRLTMILTDSRSIRDVILFPLLRPEGEIGIAQLLRDAE
ncbi:MAG: lysine--tRNA ligase [Acidobacteriota bacterium]|nr:lysine--tRNA ligase [Bryobacteraceae bacterium CoA2 C42]MCA2962496.1 lysine--tRNA ligase [Acidobacteriaceae bacterium]